MTIAPRITQRLMVEQSLTSMQAGLTRLSRTQEQLTTGRVINRPSDSPTGTNAAMRLREQLGGQAQFARNIQDGLNWLGRTDSTLSTMIDSVQKVRDLTLQGSSTGSLGAEARQALATEVGQIREGLLSLANTQHMGRPLFGGTTAGDVAYGEDTAAATDPPTYEYRGGQGSDVATQVNRTVAEGIQVRVNVTGPEAFVSGDKELFAVVADIEKHLVSDSAALEQDLIALDEVLNRMITAQADVGARYGRVETAHQANKSAELDLQAALSGIENVDMARAMVDLQMNEVAYQAALGTTARVLQPSLIDFLR